MLEVDTLVVSAFFLFINFKNISLALGGSIFLGLPNLTPFFAILILKWTLILKDFRI
jgi:hypothetical protein